METRKHKKPDSIWLFDYPSLESMDDCPEWLVLLSKRDLNIIWQSTLNIDRFRSRVFTSVNRDSYTIANLDEWGKFKEWVSDLSVHLGGYMACNDLLERIAEALEKGAANMSGCCGGIEGVNGGSSGAGMEQAPPSSTDASDDARTGPPPAGYDTWGEFDQDRCNWAHKILDDMKVDVATMGAVTITVQSATSLATLLVPLFLTPIGYVVLLQVAVIMIAAAATAGFYGAISTHLDTYRMEYICALLNGDDTVSSISNFASAVDTQIAEDGGFIALTGYWASSILKSLATVDSINRMYDKQAFSPTVGDCSECMGEILAYTNNLPCAPETDPESGHFFENEPVEITSCVGNVFGDNRSNFTIVSNPPASNIDRKVTLVSNSGLSSYYLQPYYGGSPGAGITLSAASAVGYEIECSFLIVSHPTVAATDVFSMVVKVETIP